METADLVGMVFGELTVISKAEDRILPSGRHEKMWLCGCSCGNQKVIRDASLKNGNTRSCGCIRNKLSSERMKANMTIHGYAKLRVYRTWRGMMERCYDVNTKSYYLYGGRGITVCKEWHDVGVFIEWAYANGYANDLTIDRIDSNKNYCPENCRWVDRYVQNNNTSRNHYITYDGLTLTMAQWAEKLNVSYDKIKSRLNKYGWSVERTFTTP